MTKGFEFLQTYIAKSLDDKLNYVGDLFNDDELLKEVPTCKGIYIIFSPIQKFIYPRRSSRIIYIGTSNNLRRRLSTHAKHYREAKADWNKCTVWFNHRYNYMHVFKAEVYYIKTTGNENEKYLESRALEGFYDKYGAIPVGNGAKSFRKTRI